MASGETDSGKTTIDAAVWCQPADERGVGFSAAVVCDSAGDVQRVELRMPGESTPRRFTRQHQDWHKVRAFAEGLLRIHDTLRHKRHAA